MSVARTFVLLAMEAAAGPGRIPAGKVERARFFKKLSDQAPAWLKETWAASKRSGTDKLTMKQIDAEVAAVRRHSGKSRRPVR